MLLPPGGELRRRIEAQPFVSRVTGRLIQGGALVRGDNIQPVRVVGTASDTTNSGRIATSLSIQELIGVIVGAGEQLEPQVLEQLEALADVDADGDGQDDAISATLDFSSTGANLTLQ